MDTELLVGEHIDEGQALIDRLVKEDFDVRVAFWAKATEDALWQLFIASQSLSAGTTSAAYHKAYLALDSIGAVSFSRSDLNLLSTESPIAQAAMKLRARTAPKVPVRLHGKRLGTLSAHEVYIYPQIEVPLRQAFLITYVRQDNGNDWLATTRRMEFYRGVKVKGVASYSTALWEGEKPEDQKFAHISVFVEVADGVTEQALHGNPVMILPLAQEARILADEMFLTKYPDAKITHERLIQM
jgi:hypothetical protein